MSFYLVSDRRFPGSVVELNRDHVTSETTFSDIRMQLSRELKIAPDAIALYVNSSPVVSYYQTLGEQYSDDNFLAYEVREGDVRNVSRLLDVALSDRQLRPAGNAACCGCGDLSLVKHIAGAEFCVLNCGCLACKACIEKASAAASTADPLVIVCPVHRAPTMQHVAFEDSGAITDEARRNEGCYFSRQAREKELAFLSSKVEGLRAKLATLQELAAVQDRIRSLEVAIATAEVVLKGLQERLQDLQSVAEGSDEISLQTGNIDNTVAGIAAKRQQLDCETVKQRDLTASVEPGAQVRDAQLWAAELTQTLSSQEELYNHLKESLERDRQMSSENRKALYSGTMDTDHSGVDAFVRKLQCQRKEEGVSCSRMAKSRCMCLGPFMCDECLEKHVKLFRVEDGHSGPSGTVDPAQLLRVCQNREHKQSEFSWYCVSHRALLCQGGVSPGSAANPLGCRVEAIADQRDCGFAAAAKCRREMIEAVLGCESAKRGALRAFDALTVNEYDNVLKLEDNSLSVAKDVESQCNASIAELEDIIRAIKSDRDNLLVKIRERTEALKQEFVASVRQQQQSVREYVAKAEQIATAARDVLSTLMQVVTVAPEIVAAVNNGFRDFVNAHTTLTVEPPTTISTWLHRAKTGPFGPVVKITATGGDSLPTKLTYESRRQQTVDALGTILQNNADPATSLPDLATPLRYHDQDAQESLDWVHVLRDTWVASYEVPIECLRQREGLTPEERVALLAPLPSLMERVGTVGGFKDHMERCLVGRRVGEGVDCASTDAAAVVSAFVAGMA